MATRTLKLSTQQCIPCAFSFPAEIILCVNPSKVAPHLCADDVTEQTWEYHYINALLVDTVKTCGTYTYTISYDDTQLVDGEFLLSTDISGLFCKGCETTYIEDLVGAEIGFIPEEDGSITVTTQHGCEFNFFPGESSLSVQDTESVDLTITGGVNKILTADVLISGDAGNTLEIRADGLYAADTADSFLPPSDNTTDLGSDVLRFRNLYLSSSPRFANNVYAQWRNAANSQWYDVLKLDAADDVLLNAFTGNEIWLGNNGAKAWGLNTSGAWVQDGTNGAEIVFAQTTGGVRQNTSNGSDNKRLLFTSGGSLTGSIDERGAFLDLRGNEYASTPGAASLQSGDIAGGSVLLGINSADGFVEIENSVGDILWSVSAANGTLSQGASAGGDIVFNKTAGLIRQGTANGADTGSLDLTGGGAANSNRGAYISLSGNESGGAGALQYVSGVGAGAGATHQFYTNAGAGDLLRWSVQAAGHLSQDGTNGGDLILNLATGLIRQGTSDNSDNKRIIISGGGAAGAARGGSLGLRGNEHASSPGFCELNSGDISGASIILGINSANGVVDFQNSAGASHWQVDTATGNLNGGATVGGNAVFQRADKGVVDHVTTGIAAAGTTQGTATLIADTINVVATVTAGVDDGVRLPVTLAGRKYYIFNDTASSLNIYPPVGGEIGSLGTNNPLSVIAGGAVLLVASSTIDFFSIVS